MARNLHDLAVNCSIPWQKGTEVDGGRGAALGTSSSFGLVSQTHLPACCSQNSQTQVRGGDHLFFVSWTERFWPRLLAPAAPRPSSSSSSPGSSCLPPGEEWPSALETLRVLAVGSLRRSGCFHDHRGHLDQLQGGFTVLQGLAQIQDLQVTGGVGGGRQGKGTCNVYS